MADQPASQPSEGAVSDSNQAQPASTPAIDPQVAVVPEYGQKSLDPQADVRPGLHKYSGGKSPIRGVRE